MADHPAWLDKSFLEKALQGAESQEPSHQVKVVNFSSEPAVAGGNNNNSTLSRVQVHYQTGQSEEEDTISLIVKVPLQSGAGHELSEVFDMSTKEISFYNQLQPKFKDKSKYEFGPKSFYCPIKNGLVLKDMKPDGYIMCDRLKQLDVSHCKLVVETLARFHAASVACYHDDPDLIEKVGKEYVYCEGSGFEETLKPWLKNNFKMCAEVLRKMEGQEENSDLLLSKVDSIWESMASLMKPKAESLNVLTHGDCWTCNMLFKYDDSGKVVDVTLIDFQVLRFISPVFDLLYFIWTSSNAEVKKDNIQELFEIYLETLNKSFKELGCKETLTQDRFQNEIELASDFVLVTITSFLPFMTCEDALDMENISADDFKNSETDDRLLAMYKSKHYHALLPRQLELYHAFFNL